MRGMTRNLTGLRTQPEMHEALAAVNDRAATAAHALNECDPQVAAGACDRLDEAVAALVQWHRRPRASTLEVDDG